VKLYLITLFFYSAIDFIWIGFVARPWFNRELGDLLVDSIQWIPASIFYLFYPLALLLFAIQPADSLQKAFLLGAALGLTAYAAYDLTNLATLKNWPVKLAICDMAWGAFASAITSLLVYYFRTSSWFSSGP
jgi:uncharacterized membrane protein